MAKTKREQAEREEATDAEIREAWDKAKFVLKTGRWLLVALAALLAVLHQLIQIIKEMF